MDKLVTNLINSRIEFIGTVLGVGADSTGTGTIPTTPIRPTTPVLDLDNLLLASGGSLLLASGDELLLERS